MEVMGVIAVIVNCALIGMSGQVQRMFPNLSTQGTIVLIVILEVCYTFNLFDKCIFQYVCIPIS